MKNCVKIDAVLQIFLKQNEVSIGLYPKSCREAYFIFCLFVEILMCVHFTNLEDLEGKEDLNVGWKKSWDEVKAFRC